MSMKLTNLLLLIVMVNAKVSEEQTTAHEEIRKSSNTTAKTGASQQSICPTWFYPDPSSNGTCKCGNDVHGAIKCDDSTKEVRILDCYCMTYNNLTGPVVGPCIYNCIHRNLKKTVRLYFPVPSILDTLNHKMCGQKNRQGQLCGKCANDHYPLVYSYHLNCKKCSASFLHWLEYILLAFLPLTVFLIIVLSCGLSATSPQLSAFVFFSQTIAAGANVRIVLAEIDSYPLAANIAKIMFSFYGIWNLDFFRPFISHVCIQISTLQALALDYAVAFYPLLMLLVTYMLLQLHPCNIRIFALLCHPFCRYTDRLRSQCDIKSSIVGAFATFFLLSYLKLLSVSFDLLVPMNVHSMNGTVGSYLYYDATIKFFGHEHLPYAVLALFIVFVFLLFPLLLLLLYPMRCFQRCLGCCRVRWHALPIFIDAFQGCYKDGTNGTRDCRYFAAVYLIVRFVLFIFYGFTLNSVLYATATVVLICLAVSIAIIQPYKPHLASYNTISSLLVLNLALWCATVTCITLTGLLLQRLHHAAMILSFFVGALPLFYMSFVFLCWLCSRKDIGQRVKRRIRTWIRENSRQLSETDLEESLPDRLINPGEYEEITNSVPSEVGYENHSLSCPSNTTNENQSTY